MHYVELKWIHLSERGNMNGFNEDYDKYEDRGKYVRTQFSDKAHTLSYLLAVIGQNNVYTSFEAIAETRSNGISIETALSKTNLRRKVLYSCLNKLLCIGVIYRKGKTYCITPFGEDIHSSLEIIKDAISIRSQLQIVDAILPSNTENPIDNICTIIDSLVKHQAIQEILKKVLTERCS